MNDQWKLDLEAISLIIKGLRAEVARLDREQAAANARADKAEAELAVAMRERNDAIQASLKDMTELAAATEKNRQLAKLLDDQLGTPCEQIRHQQELAAAREDAERYRWLRVNWGENADGRWDHGISPGKLDSVIDAALDAGE